MSKTLTQIVVLSIFGFFLSVFAQEATTQPRILVGSPVRQKPTILKEFLESLDRLPQQHYSLEYFFVDDNVADESSQMLRKFAQDHPGKCTILDAKNPTNKDHFICNEITHYWNESLVWKVASFKNIIIEHARANNYSHLFLIDSDIVLHPKTIDQLLGAKKDIISEIFWSKWAPNLPEQPQVWMTDLYNQYTSEIGEKLTTEEIEKRTAAFYDQLRIPGVYEVGGLCACTLVNKHALDCGVSFKRIKNVLFWGEDRHFCIRAVALGLSLFVDTHYPAYHIYRESELPGVAAFKRSCNLSQRITLSMIVQNEASRYLRRVLQAAKAYITNAVIIDDASTDDTVAVCKEVLKDIPLVLIENKESKFSNEVLLRKQQWEETIKTNPDWILTLDADEIFETKFATEVQELIKNTAVDAYYFRLYDMWNEEQYRDDTWWSAHKYYRPFLIRYKPSITYTWKETAQHCGRFPLEIQQFHYKTSNLRLKHYGWANETNRITKYHRYQQLDPKAIYGIKEQYESILDPNPHLVRWVENDTSSGVNAFTQSCCTNQVITSDENKFKSRYMLTTDPMVKSVADIDLPATWWSRPAEYSWAMQFAGQNDVVLDAACGISHPFKWFLGGNCKCAWACDIDMKIADIGKILQETLTDLGEKALFALTKNQLWKKVNLLNASICALPDKLPQFDRIFCISTLEHLSPADRKQALAQFAKFLAPNGLVVLTIDCSTVPLDEFMQNVSEAGLIPTGEIDIQKPIAQLLQSDMYYQTHGTLSIFRCVLRKGA